MNTTRTRKKNETDPAISTTKPPVKRGKKASTGPVADTVTEPQGVSAVSPVKRKSSPKAPKDSTVAVAPGVLVRRVAKSKKAPEPTLDVRVRDAIVARLDAMKASELKVIDVRGKTSITDCLVIASGTSTRHVKSMGDEVVVTAKNLGMAPIGIEGEQDAEWILVDLGDTVVHVMLPRAREFYQLERLWSLAEEARAATAALA